jgi:hypothetical protein
MSRPARSKTVATWLAVAGGAMGLHRFYLHGLRDRWAWLHPWPTLVGIVGVLRMDTLGQDDHLAWVLIPFFGIMVAVGMVSAIVIGLTPDEKWNARFSPDQPGTTAWAPILGVIAALLIGGAALMGSIAFAGQKYFEWQQITAQDPDASAVNQNK